VAKRDGQSDDREKRDVGSSRPHRPESLPRLYRQFRRAASRRDGGTVAALIRAHPALRDYDGEAGSLVDVLDSEAPELLEAAFEAGLSPDAGSEAPCQTFLQLAVAEGDLGKVRLALRYGADPDRRNDWGEVALGYACSWGQLEAAKLLVDAGADVNIVEERAETNDRRTPLDCTRNHPEIARYLRSKGAKHFHELETTPARREESGD